MTKNEVKQNDDGIKDEYFFTDTTGLDELYCPVVEYKFTDHPELEKMKSKNYDNVIYHLFLIDISNFSLSLNFSQYVK